LHSLEDLKRMPFTLKSQLVEDRENHPPLARILPFRSTDTYACTRPRAQRGSLSAGSTRARAGTGGHAVGQPFITPPASPPRIASFLNSLLALLSDSGRLGLVVKRSRLSPSRVAPGIHISA
jgi:hypothetical protein